MTDEKITELGQIELPFQRVATLRRVEFESGLTMVRLVLREGRRITQVDLDENSASALGTALVTAAADVAGHSVQ